MVRVGGMFSDWFHPLHLFSVFPLNTRKTLIPCNCFINITFAIVMLLTIVKRGETLWLLSGSMGGMMRLLPTEASCGTWAHGGQDILCISWQKLLHFSLPCFNFRNEQEGLFGMTWQSLGKIKVLQFGRRWHLFTDKTKAISTLDERMYNYSHPGSLHSSAVSATNIYFL